MMGPVVLLEKAHRNAESSERSPTDQGRGREAAAAVGVGSRENASSSGCKDTTGSGGDGGDPRDRESSMVGSLEKVSCAGSRDQGAWHHSGGSRSGKSTQGAVPKYEGGLTFMICPLRLHGTQALAPWFYRCCEKGRIQPRVCKSRGQRGLKTWAQSRGSPGQTLPAPKVCGQGSQMDRGTQDTFLAWGSCVILSWLGELCDLESVTSASLCLGFHT